jgi:hypothetical protein
MHETSVTLLTNKQLYNSNYHNFEPLMSMVHIYTPVYVSHKKTCENTCVKPRIFIENLNPCTIAIVLGSVAIAYRTSHR